MLTAKSKRLAITAFDLDDEDDHADYEMGVNAKNMAIFIEDMLNYLRHIYKEYDTSIYDLVLKDFNEYSTPLEELTEKEKSLIYYAAMAIRDAFFEKIKENKLSDSDLF